MSVTACFVTRNQAASLAAALESVRGFATQLLVADTGSTDDTVTIAKRAGATVLPIAWADDFAAACNQALAAATGDWILWMNPDEELTRADIPSLSAAVADETTFAFQLRLQQQLRPNDPDRGTTGREERLYRRDPAVRYVGRLHPEFATPLHSIAAERNQQTKVLEATIVRHAYRSTPTPDKMRWVVRLLEAELQDRPERLECKIELGRNLLWLNDPRGHEMLAEAAKEVATWPRSRKQAHPMIGMLFEYILSAEPSPVHSALSVLQVHKLIELWFPRTPPVLWAAAQERSRAGDFLTAAKYLDRLLDIGQTGWYDSMSFDPDIIGPAAAMNLGVCYLQLKDWVLARACFEHLLNDSRFGEHARRYHAQADAEMRASHQNNS